MVGDAEVRAELGAVLRELDEPLPDWALAEPPLRRAEHMRQDPFRERESWALHYDDAVLVVTQEHRVDPPLASLLVVESPVAFEVDEEDEEDRWTGVEVR